MFIDLSGVPVPIHIEEPQVEGNLPPNLIEASVGLVVVADHITVGAITERRIGRVLAVAQLVVATLGDVVGDGAASGHRRVAGAVAGGVRHGQAARTPGVDLAGLQVPVVWVVAWVRAWAHLIRRARWVGGICLPCSGSTRGSAPSCTGGNP